MTKESRPSVIQLSPAEPVPKPTSTDAELIPETYASLRALGPNITIRRMAEPDPESWKHTLHAIRFPDDKDDFFPRLHLPETTEIASRVSVIRENPTLAEKPAPIINKDPIDAATIEEDLRRLRLIQSLFDKNQNLNDDEEFFEPKKTPQKRPIQEVAANSITKRLQPVQQDSIFSIEQTFGTRRNTRRVSDVFGYGAGTDNDLEAALKASLEDSNANITSPANTSGAKPRKIRRSHGARKSGGQIMTEVST